MHDGFKFLVDFLWTICDNKFENVAGGENAMDIEFTEDIEKFTETYSSFNKIVNKLQRQYLSLKETYTRQSEELQTVNKTLQSLMNENVAVTEFLNSVLNSLSSGVIAIDEAGRFTLINPAARKILGLDEADRGGEETHYDEVIVAEENAECSAVETMRTGRIFDSADKKVRTFHGAVLTLSVSTSLLRNQGGQVVGAVELFYDISKIKRMEEQLSRMKVLASLGEMAASIAHEVRNPLAGIGGFASLLARDLENDSSKKEMARKIVEGVQSINNTVQTLLDFARSEKVHKARVDLNAYLNIVLDDFIEGSGFPPERIKRGFSMETDIGVELDRQLFKQAICNLVKNGLEAGEEDTSVRIKTEILPLATVHRDYAHRLELSATETLAEIVVEDNGPGIPEEEVGRIFSPFFSTKENGTGLGLSIAWKIIKAHGGDLAAESEAGGRTRFSIVLPAKTPVRMEK
jgi:PAS domain S-box-containing protein